MANDCPQCAKAKQLLEEWSAQQSQERCWYYPDIFRSLATIFNVRLRFEPKLPLRREFEAGLNWPL